MWGALVLETKYLKNKIILASKAHILKFWHYREDFHGPYVRITGRLWSVLYFSKFCIIYILPE